MLHDWFGWAWGLFIVIWVVAAVGTKRTVRHEAFRDSIVHTVLFWIAIMLLFRPQTVGLLDIDILPGLPGIEIAGLIVTVLGLSFAVWARVAIGRNWSGSVTIKENHELIREGPYKFVRHPIYSGLLLAVAGTAIGYRELPGLLAVPVAFLGCWQKSRSEERFMTTQFGEQYVRYRGEVSGFIPGVL